MAVKETGDTQAYFMDSSISGQDGPNPVLRLATLPGKVGLSCLHVPGMTICITREFDIL